MAVQTKLNDHQLKSELLFMGTEPRLLNGKTVNRIYKDRWCIGNDMNADYLTMDEIVSKLSQETGG